MMHKLFSPNLYDDSGDELADSRYSSSKFLRPIRMHLRVLEAGSSQMKLIITGSISVMINLNCLHTRIMMTTIEDIFED